MATAIGISGRFTVRRSPDNPLDKTTIISVYPKPIEVINHTTFPGRFNIDAGNIEKPAIEVIGSSSWYKDISRPEDRQPDFAEMKVSSIEMAASYVDDYCRGLILADTEKRPGLFYIPGDISVFGENGFDYNKTITKLKMNHKTLIDAAIERQKAWFFELVNMADAFWQASQSPRSIDANMRMAAIELQLHEGKPWMADLSKMKMENCPACGFLRNPLFPVCANCNTVVDETKFAALGLKRSAK